MPLMRKNLALQQQNASLNSDNPVLRLTRAGGNVSGNLPGTDWTVFVSDDPNYMPLEWACSSVPHFAQEKLVSAVLVSDITKLVKSRNPLNPYLVFINPYDPGDVTITLEKI